MSEIQLSFPPQYLNDQTSFRESLKQLSTASSLTVNPQGTLVPSNWFNDLFSGGSVTSHLRLVELKIIELLAHGKKWLRPEDITLVKQLAGKAGLFTGKEGNAHDHKELSVLIHLISKEVLKEPVSTKTYENLCKTFQVHYRNALKPFTKQCEQVTRNFAEMFQLKNENVEQDRESAGDETSKHNRQDTEEHHQSEAEKSHLSNENVRFEKDFAAEALAERNRRAAVSSFAIPNTNDSENIAGPAPAILRVRKPVDGNDETQQLIKKVALGAAAAIGAGTLYLGYKKLMEGDATPISLPSDTPSFSPAGLVTVVTGLTTMVIVTVACYFKYRNVNQKDDSSPKILKSKKEQNREVEETKKPSELPKARTNVDGLFDGRSKPRENQDRTKLSQRARRIVNADSKPIVSVQSNPEKLKENTKDVNQESDSSSKEIKSGKDHNEKMEETKKPPEHPKVRTNVDVLTDGRSKPREDQSRIKRSKSAPHIGFNKEDSKKTINDNQEHIEKQNETTSEESQIPHVEPEREDHEQHETTEKIIRIVEHDVNEVEDEKLKQLKAEEAKAEQQRLNEQNKLAAEREQRESSVKPISNLLDDASKIESKEQVGSEQETPIENVQNSPKKTQEEGVVTKNAPLSATKNIRITPHKKRSGIEKNRTYTQFETRTYSTAQTAHAPEQGEKDPVKNNASLSPYSQHSMGWAAKKQQRLPSPLSDSDNMGKIRDSSSPLSMRQNEVEAAPIFSRRLFSSQTTSYNSVADKERDEKVCMLFLAAFLMSQNNGLYKDFDRYEEFKDVNEDQAVDLLKTFDLNVLGVIKRDLEQAFKKTPDNPVNVNTQYTPSILKSKKRTDNLDEITKAYENKKEKWKEVYVKFPEFKSYLEKASDFLLYGNFARHEEFKNLSKKEEIVELLKSFKINELGVMRSYFLKYDHSKMKEKKKRSEKDLGVPKSKPDMISITPSAVPLKEGFTLQDFDEIVRPFRHYENEWIGIYTEKQDFLQCIIAAYEHVYATVYANESTQSSDESSEGEYVSEEEDTNNRSDAVVVDNDLTSMSLLVNGDISGS